MFITFEGIEGCGKTTLLRTLATTLKKSGRQLVQTREPGGSLLGCHLREILLAQNKMKIVPEAELFLFLADRAQHLDEVIKPALSAKKWVLCDRFSDSTIAYQKYGRKLSHLEIPFLEPTPDLTFLIDVNVETGLKRALARNQETGNGNETKFDNERLDFHQRVRHGFLELAKKYPERIKVLDGHKTPTQLCQDCLVLLDDFSGNKSSQ